MGRAPGAALLPGVVERSASGGVPTARRTGDAARVDPGGPSPVADLRRGARAPWGRPRAVPRVVLLRSEWQARTAALTVRAMQHTHDDPVPPSESDEQITVATRDAGDGRVVVEVGGEVDMLTSPQLRSAVLAALADTPGTVVLALDSVTFLGTSGLAVLIEVREAAQQAGVSLRLACTGRRVLRPLSIAGLVPMFEVRDTVEDALSAVT